MTLEVIYVTRHGVSANDITFSILFRFLFLNARPLRLPRQPLSFGRLPAPWFRRPQRDISWELRVSHRRASAGSGTNCYQRME